MAVGLIVGAIARQVLAHPIREAQIRQLKRDTARIIGGLSLNITSNIDQVQRRLTDIERRQVCGSSVGRERCRPKVSGTEDSVRGSTNVRFGISQQATNPVYAGNGWNPMCQ